MAVSPTGVSYNNIVSRSWEKRGRTSGTAPSSYEIYSGQTSPIPSPVSTATSSTTPEKVQELTGQEKQQALEQVGFHTVTIGGRSVAVMALNQADKQKLLEQSRNVTGSRYEVTITNRARPQQINNTQQTNNTQQSPVFKKSQTTDEGKVIGITSQGIGIKDGQVVPNILAGPGVIRQKTFGSSTTTTITQKEIDNSISKITFSETGRGSGAIINPLDTTAKIRKEKASFTKGALSYPYNILKNPKGELIDFQISAEKTSEKLSSGVPGVLYVPASLAGTAVSGGLMTAVSLTRPKETVIGTGSAVVSFVKNPPAAIAKIGPALESRPLPEYAAEIYGGAKVLTPIGKGIVEVSPIKIRAQKVVTTTEAGEEAGVLYRGLGYTKGYGPKAKTAILLGYEYGKGFVKGTPNLAGKFEKLAPGQEVLISNEFTTAIAKESLPGIKGGTTLQVARRQNAVGVFEDVSIITRDVPSKFVAEKLPAETKTLSSRGVQIVDQVIVGERATQFGGRSKLAQLGPEEKALKPYTSDIDVELQPSATIFDVERVTIETASRLRKEPAVPIRARPISGKQGAIEAMQVGGEYEKIVEFKGAGIDEVPDKVVGQPIQSGRINIGGVQSTALNEELRRNIQGIARIRKDTLGVVDVYPAAKRTKDIISTAQDLESLYKSRPSKKLRSDIDEFKRLYEYEKVKGEVLPESPKVSVSKLQGESPLKKFVSKLPKISSTTSSSSSVIGSINVKSLTDSSKSVSISKSASPSLSMYSGSKSQSTSSKSLSPSKYSFSIDKSSTTSISKSISNSLSKSISSKSISSSSSSSSSSKSYIISPPIITPQKSFPVGNDILGNIKGKKKSTGLSSRYIKDFTVGQFEALYKISPRARRPTKLRKIGFTGFELRT